MPAHGVGHSDVGRRAVWQHDLLHEKGQVPIEIGERSHVAFSGVGKHPARAPLAAPVHSSHGKAAPAQVGHHLEILLDELAPALKQADRAFTRPAGGIPARKAQGQLVVPLEGAGHGAAGNRVLGQRDQVHARLRRLEPLPLPPLRG